MSLLDLIRLLVKHIKLLLAIPLVAAVAVFFQVKDSPRSYTSSTIVYTGLVSGYTIESAPQARLDHHVANGGFDNLINLIQAKETLEEVSIQLIAGHLSGKLHVTGILPSNLPWPSQGREEIILPSPDTLPAGVDPVVYFVRTAAQDPQDPIYHVIHRTQSPFSIRGIGSSLTVKRIGVSDLIRMDYGTDDAVLTQATLIEITKAATANYKALRSGEAAHVMSFFEAERERLYGLLTDNIEELRSFGTENRVINYYEQTKFIASQTELIDQQLQQERMALSASESALETLEEKIGITNELMLRNSRILEKRKELSLLTAQATLDEASGTASLGTQARIDTLRIELTQEIRDLNQLNHSREGIARDELISQWLNSVVAVNEKRSRLAVLEARRADYRKTYDQFAPLGATLGSLEREVEISEREYLDLLRSLNLARMRQQNIEMASKLSVVDPPRFPESPEASKSMMLVMLAFLATFVVLFGGVICTEVFDFTIKSPMRAVELTQLRLIGAFPAAMPKAKESFKRLLWRRLARQLEYNLKLEIKSLAAENPSVERRTKVIALTSFWAGVNTHVIAEALHRSMLASKDTVLHLVPEEKPVLVDDSEDGKKKKRPQKEKKPKEKKKKKGEEALPPLEPLVLTHYRFEHSAMAYRELSELVTMPAEEIARHDYVILEFEALSRNDVPIHLLQKADLLVVNARVDRVWGSSHEMLREALKEAHERDPLLVVSAVRDSGIEEVLDEIPKKRSTIRILIKRIIRGELSSE